MLWPTVSMTSSRLPRVACLARLSEKPSPCRPQPACPTATCDYTKLLVERANVRKQPEGREARRAGMTLVPPGGQCKFVLEQSARCRTASEASPSQHRD